LLMFVSKMKALSVASSCDLVGRDVELMKDPGVPVAAVEEPEGGCESETEGLRLRRMWPARA
jgi:hypothetical protein